MVVLLQGYRFFELGETLSPSEILNDQCGQFAVLPHLGSIQGALNKQYEKSLEFARKALNKNPKHSLNLLNLADIEMILGNKEVAVSYYQQVVAAWEGEEEVKYLLGLAQAYGQLKYSTLAIDTLKKAQLLAPNNGEVSYSSSIVYSLLEEKASAIHHVKAALMNNVGIVWFNLPWFDKLCNEQEFQQIMKKHDNAARCIN